MKNLPSWDSKVRNQLEQDQDTSPESLQGAPSMVPVLGHQVEVVDSFIYLGSYIEPGGESDVDICR